LVDIVGTEAKLVVIAKAKMGISVAANGGIEAYATVFVAIGRQIGATAG
jgi:hypothetical protein